MIASCKANGNKNFSMYVISSLKKVLKYPYFYLLDYIDLEKPHLELNSTTICLHLGQNRKKREEVE